MCLCCKLMLYSVELCRPHLTTCKQATWRIRLVDLAPLLVQELADAAFLGGGRFQIVETAEQQFVPSLRWIYASVRSNSSVHAPPRAIASQDGAIFLESK